MTFRSGRKFAIGALVAGITGYLVGILTAPKTGSESRKEIEESARIAIAKAEKELKSVHTDLQVIINRAAKTMLSGGKQIQKEFEKAIDRAKKSQKKVRVIISSIHEGTSDDLELKSAIDEAKSAKAHLSKYLSK